MFLAVAAAVAPTPGEAAQTTLAWVVMVHSGAALVVETPEGVRITLHLLGVEAPALRAVHPRGGPGPVGEPFSEEAKTALEDLVLDKEVRVFLYGRNAFRQVLAEVFVEGESVNLHMVRGGLARVARGAPRVPDALRQGLEQAEAEARRERRGIWMFD